MDLVRNHVARVFVYPDGDQFRATAAPDIRWLYDIEPAVPADPACFSRREIIRDRTDEEQAVRGDFPPGLRRLASEDPRTVDLLIGIARWWVRQTDADGVRIDAIRHLDPGFVERT